MAGSWWGGEGCDCEVPRGLPRKKEPRMDWRAEGEASPKVNGSIDGKADARPLLSSSSPLWLSLRKVELDVDRGQAPTWLFDAVSRFGLAAALPPSQPSLPGHTQGHIFIQLGLSAVFCIMTAICVYDFLASDLAREQRQATVPR